MYFVPDISPGSQKCCFVQVVNGKDIAVFHEKAGTKGSTGHEKLRTTWNEILDGP